MFKSSLAASLLALTAFGWIQQRTRPIVPLGEGTMTLEYMVGVEAVVRVETESEEELERVQVRGPDGRRFLEFAASDTQHSLSGVVMELRETNLDAILASYVEGDYDIRAHTRDGKQAVGKVHFSFDLPAAPRIVYPPAGALVPSNGLTVVWLADRGAAGYRVQLEQGESDGLAVNLPPGRSSFQVPAGFLARGVETRVEISAIGANGNRTVVETVFTTRP